MPLYEFVCKDHHITESICKVDLSDAPTTCPYPRTRGDKQEPCGYPITKKISAPSGSFPGADSWRAG